MKWPELLGRTTDAEFELLKQIERLPDGEICFLPAGCNKTLLTLESRKLAQVRRDSSADPLRVYLTRRGMELLGALEAIEKQE